VAYRTARLPRPVVPATSDELRQRGSDYAEVPGRSIAADQMVAALAAATGVIAVAALVIMLPSHGWAPPVLAAVASGLLLLRARLFTGLTARAWLLAAGLACAMLETVALAARWSPVGVASLAVGAAVLAALVARAAISARRMSPPLVRVVDLIELMATIATVPLALEVLGVYARVRGLGG